MIFVLIWYDICACVYYVYMCQYIIHNICADMLWYMCMCVYVLCQYTCINMMWIPHILHVSIYNTWYLCWYDMIYVHVCICLHVSIYNTWYLCWYDMIYVHVCIFYMCQYIIQDICADMIWYMCMCIYVYMCHI